MGNSLSPALADLVLTTLLDDVLAKIDVHIPFFKKYVDDFVTALPADKIEYTKNILNGYNKHIQFTCEVECNNRLPYLDMVLIRSEQQKIVTDWYKKPVASGRILNYFSLHPLAQKLNVVSGFIGRIYRLATSKSNEEKNKLIHDQLRSNNYPKGLINRLINRFNNQNTQPVSLINAEPKTYRALFYVDSLTPALARIIRRNFKNVALSFKSVKTNRSLFSKLKDPASLLSRRNVIYRIPCSEPTCASSYIGMTTQQLKNRLAGHRSLLKRYEEYKLCNSTNTGGEEEFKKTALMKHAIENNHKFDLTSVKILDSDDRLQALQILEICHILTDNSSINYRTDTNNLSVAYSGILHSLAHF